MTHLLRITAAFLCVCALQAVSGLTAEEYKRALKALGIFEEENSMRRRIFSCKSLGSDCKGYVNCCGTTQCYWKDGYSMITDGVCVTCVQKTKLCQRDDQCCGNLMCDKGNVLHVDGKCHKKRTSGSCYRDGQCENDCEKKWYQTSGECE